MDLNLNIQKLGKVNDIFGFYNYAIDHFESKNHVLLESVNETSQEMLFSFIGLKPDLMIKVIGDEMKIYDITTEKGEKMKKLCEESPHEKFKDDRPFEDTVPMNIPCLDKLKAFFPITRSAMPELFPRKVFSGGLLGYIGYDVVAPFVGYKPNEKIQDQFPDAVLGLFTNVLAFSHTTNTLYEINNNIGSEQANGEVRMLMEKFLSNKPPGIKKPTKKQIADARSAISQFKTNTSLDQWEKMIGDTKEHLFAGDIIQAVISRKMSQETDIPPIEVYRALKYVNPTPYMYYINFDKAHNGDIRLIGASPEALITKNQNHLETVPIAGTRRRGRDAEDEVRMEQELLNSDKELAEHIMLVDLARNDLARVSLPGTVDTYELISLRKYPTVMHLISKVKSLSKLDPFSILKAMFPAGTVSGAPKKRAMEIINRIERENRGPYAGCVGYISFTGDMDMAISIRTLFNKNKTYYAQAGAGIVADSKPDEEYLETQNKMQGMLSTINLAGSMQKT
jgi:anthranilate synthase component 1